MTPSSTPMSDEQEDELDDKIIDIVKSLSMFSFHRGNWQKPIELHELVEYTTAIKSLIAHHTKEAVEAARKSTAKIYEKEIQYLRAFQDLAIQREQLRLPATMYLCSDPKCSKLHTRAELAAPAIHKRDMEGSGKDE